MPSNEREYNFRLKRKGDRGGYDRTKGKWLELGNARPARPCQARRDGTILRACLIKSQMAIASSWPVQDHPRTVLGRCRMMNKESTFDDL